MVLPKTYIMLHIVTMECHDTILCIYISMLMAVALDGKMVANCNDLLPSRLTNVHPAPSSFDCHSGESRKGLDE